MKEEIIWKLVYWDMKVLRDGWFGKPIYAIKLEYGAYRNDSAETKWTHEKFKTLEQAFEYLEKAMDRAEKVKL